MKLRGDFAMISAVPFAWLNSLSVKPGREQVIREYGKTLEKASREIKNVDSIITGHANKLMTMADLKDFADYNNDFIEWVKKEIKAGKTSDQAVMEYKVPERFAAKGVTASTGGLFGGIKNNIDTAYKELKK